MKMILVAGARPNFMKIAPLMAEVLSRPEIQPLLLHTGQHYDPEMSDVFFEQLGIPKPDIFLGIGSGSHAEQTAKVMLEFEKVCLNEKPDLVLVVGDVNSTLACALVASKMNIKVAHVEAGLRSRDRTMPEEINRLVTDSISDFLFTPSEDADINLGQEGIGKEKIHFVGNVMIDTLLKFKNQAKLASKIKLNRTDYVLATMHRPSNVDNKAIFENILLILNEISMTIPVLFTSHPRTQKQIEFFELQKYFNFLDTTADEILDIKPTINAFRPLPYMEFLNLMSEAKAVLTDSGGIQEETTILGVPCLTLRENTERPITIHEGTNRLVGLDRDSILTSMQEIMTGQWKRGGQPKYWDGQASARIIDILTNHYADTKR
jgi:UDP-N-acetylglucosamine 2-epimerase (non-hydrolysing)